MNQTRIRLIKEIQERRQSCLIVYITGDRQGVEAQIGGDVIRPFYEHLRDLHNEEVSKIDLFLYSRGGSVDVPWPLVTMIREFCKEFNVLIPFRAFSAATLIALGADHIVMGKLGELGPIDPLISKPQQGEQSVAIQQMSVEDVMAFISFLKERAGLGDQAALANMVSILVDKLTPWTLGAVYRTHSHIRQIARKLITTHKDSLEERQISSIIETLAEKTYFHGHAIGRREASEVGLPVEIADEELDNLMWSLLESYEQLMKINSPFDPVSAIPEGLNQYSEQVVMAIVESEKKSHVFRGNLHLNHVRQLPSQMTFNTPINLSLPPDISPEQIPVQVQQILQNLLAQLQNQAVQIIQGELNKQAPIIRTDGSLRNAFWQNVTDEDT